MEQRPLIKSISYDQNEILQWIIRLYAPAERFDADATYSKGGFYTVIPPPALRYDLTPVSPDVTQADCRHLPLESGSIHSLILDPPFLATTGKSLVTSLGNIISRRFSVCKSEQELSQLYQDAIKEAYRVLADRGVLVFKCQDKVSSGKQYMMHCHVYNWATAIGFEPLDLFVLLAKNRLVADWQRNQKHARKYHAYFWVFRKKVIPLERNHTERLHRR